MRGLSQEQLALASGITTTYLGLLERNLKNPTIKVIEQICNALQISLKDFFNEAVQDFPCDSTALQIQHLLSSCNEEEKKIILNCVKEMVHMTQLQK